MIQKNCIYVYVNVIAHIIWNLHMSNKLLATVPEALEYDLGRLFGDSS